MQLLKDEVDDEPSFLSSLYIMKKICKFELSDKIVFQNEKSICLNWTKFFSCLFMIQFLSFLFIFFLLAFPWNLSCVDFFQMSLYPRDIYITTAMNWIVWIVSRTYELGIVSRALWTLVLLDTELRQSADKRHR